MQLDGNLVLYSNSVIIWSTKTNNGVRFEMSSSGNAVLVDKNNQLLFSTGTDQNGEYFEVLNNGNIAVFNKDNKQIWSLNTNTGLIIL